MILGSGLLQSGRTTLTLQTTKAGTFNPTIVASDTSGIVWDFGDGSATYTGGTPSHTYADGTQKTVTITFDDPTVVTQLVFGVQSLVGNFALASLTNFTSLTKLQINNSTEFVATGNLQTLPSTVNTVNLSVTGSTAIGNIANLPNITYLNVYSSNVVITGALSDLSAEFTYLSLLSTPSIISGGPTAMLATGIQQLLLQSTSTTQANIDDILLRLYTDRASFTYATPTLNVGGTNPNPTGTYQDATPPTTGLEYAYKLVNDPDTEGFNTWTVTY